MNELESFTFVKGCHLINYLFLVRNNKVIYYCTKFGLKSLPGVKSYFICFVSKVFQRTPFYVYFKGMMLGWNSLWQQHFVIQQQRVFFPILHEFFFLQNC